MVRYGFGFYAVPSSHGPGEYMAYVTATVWEDNEVVTTFEIGQKRLTGKPDIRTTTDVNDLAVNWSDDFYQLATEIYAAAKLRGDSEINARPSSASTN